MANDDLSLAKDCIYIITAAIGTIVGILTSCVGIWRDKKNRDDQWKREDERIREQKIQKEKDRQRADAEKIEAIYEHFCKVKKKFVRLKKSLDILDKKKIVNDFSELDVLIYMCREKNWEKFHHECIGVATESPEDPRDDLISDVKEIMKFILDLRIKSLYIMKNQAFPDDIKSKIIEMGESVYSFVQKDKQDVIHEVLKYFYPAQTVLELEHLNEEHENLDENPGFQNQSLSLLRRRRRIQQTSKGKTKRPAKDTIIEMQSTTSTSSYSPTAIRPPNLRIWPGDAAIENAIPYLKCFEYPKYGEKMTLEFTDMHFNIFCLMRHIEEGEIKENDELLGEINKLWKVMGHEELSGGLLHSIRMINYKICTLKINLGHHDFVERYQRSIDNIFKSIKDIIDNDTPTSENAKLLRDVGSNCIELRKRQYLSLLNKRETLYMLKNLKKEIQKLTSEGHS